MQSSLLKRISSFRTKEELLDFVAAYHMLLDPINLVTCLYRLAKMSFSQRSRNAYLTELQRSPTFQLLLRSISAQFLHAQLMYMQHHTEPKGVDGRCLANLVWALAKLDLSSEDTALSTEIALNVAPFVLRCLGGSSPQGLANMLWSYAKLPVAPPEVVAALVGKITSQLRASLRASPAGAVDDGGKLTFDAQALSNSIWALAHLKSRGMDLDGFGDITLAFLEAVAAAATRMLARLQHQLLALPRPAGPGGVPDASQLLAAAEADFSCQALVNICWALATIAGELCATHAPFRQLFSVVNAESIGRLRATAALLRARQPLPYHGVGGFNEQALSNAVYAFDKAGLLQHELLSAIFEVATLRLQLGGGGGGGGSHDGGVSLSFKPQELCTLLKVCHSGVAPPWAFLAALLQLLAVNPAAVDNWSAAEKAELQRAYLLYHQQHQAVLQQQQQQQQQQQGALNNLVLLAQLGLLDAQQQEAVGAAAQQQSMATAIAALERRQQAQALAGLAPAQQAGAQQRAAAGTARPPPAALPPFSQPQPSGMFGGAARQPAASAPMGGALFSTAMLDAGLSSAGTSPRTPPPGMGALAAPACAPTPPLGPQQASVPRVDLACNKQQRARLAHAPAQQQMALFAQTQRRLAGEGLATSTAGSLWGASPAADPVAHAAPATSPAAPAGGAPSFGPGAVDGASLRPWLMDAAAAAAAAVAPRF